MHLNCSVKTYGIHMIVIINIKDITNTHTAYSTAITTTTG